MTKPAKKQNLCKRCGFPMHLTRAQCDVCGLKVSRRREFMIAVVGMALGLSLGWAVVSLIQLGTEGARANPAQSLTLIGMLMIFVGIVLWQLWQARRGENA